MANNEIYKVSVLGAGGVGKSTCIVQFVAGTFVEADDPTIEDAYRKNEKVDDEYALLEILDTAGQETFNTVRDTFFRETRGFLIIYSITSRTSFDDVAALYNECIKGIKNVDQFPTVIIGNKCDLELERQVSKEEGQELAALYGCPFFEISAKSHTNVTEVFHEVVREFRKYENIGTKVEYKN